MKKFKIYTLTVLLLSSMVLFNWTCTTEDNPGPEVVLTADKTNVMPYEVIEISCEGITLTSKDYNGRLGDTEVLLYNVDEKLQFIVPNISKGQYILDIYIINQTYELDFDVQELQQIPDPEEYISTFLIEQEEIISLNTDYISQLVPEGEIEMYTLELEQINQIFIDAAEMIQSASDEEKLEAAQFINVNKDDFELLQSSIDDYMQAVINLKQNGNKAVWDSEDEFNTAYIEFIKTRIKLIKSAKKIIAWTSSGAIIGSVFPGIGTGVGAAIGAGMGIGNFLLALNADNMATNQLVNYESIVEILSAELKSRDIVFNNNEKVSLNIYGEYHNLNNEYSSSTMPKIEEFISYLSVFAVLFDQINSILPEIVQMKPKVISDLTTINSVTRTAHAKYISIENISNSNVSVLPENIDGEFKIECSTSEIDNQVFSFDIIYTNPDYSVESNTIYANLHTNNMLIRVENIVVPCDTCDMPAISTFSNGASFIELGFGSSYDFTVGNDNPRLYLWTCYPDCIWKSYALPQIIGDNIIYDEFNPYHRKLMFTRIK